MSWQVTAIYISQEMWEVTDISLEATVAWNVADIWLESTPDAANWAVTQIVLSGDSYWSVHDINMVAGQVGSWSVQDVNLVAGSPIVAWRVSEIQLVANLETKDDTLFVYHDGDWVPGVLYAYIGGGTWVLV